MKNNPVRLASLLFMFISNFLFGCNASENQSSTSQENGKINQTVSAEEFDKLSQNTSQLVDVRTSAEFSGGFIKNAINMDINSSDFSERVKKLEKNQPVFVYCLSGGRSAKAADVLSEMGFKEVYNLNGGIMKWQSEGRPLTNLKQTSGSKEISIQDFTSIVKSKKKVIVDFYAPWCVPCKRMAPYLEKMSKEDPNNLLIYKLNADENKSLCKALKVEGLPVVEYYKEGKLIWRHEGFIDEVELRKKIAD